MKSSIAILLTGLQGRAFLSLMQARGSTTEVQAPGKSTTRWRARLILLTVFVILLGGLFGVGLVVVRKLTSVYTDIRSHVSGPHDAPTAARPMAISKPCWEVPSASIEEIRARQANAIVPLVPNLVLDVIWTVQQYDLETLIKFQSVDDHTVTTIQFRLVAADLASPGTTARWW